MLIELRQLFNSAKKRSINHSKLTYCLLYMMNVTHDHARVNILNVEVYREISHE